MLYWTTAFPALGVVRVSLPFLLPFALIGHDLLTNRRVHRATGIGVAVVVASNIVGFAVASSPLGAALIAALE